MGTSPPTIFKIIYKSGANKPADYLSRHPTNESKQKQEKMTEQYINFITQNSVPKAMTLQEIINATNADAALTARGVTRVLIGGGVYSYIRFLPDEFLLNFFVFKFISKETNIFIMVVLDSDNFSFLIYHVLCRFFCVLITSEIRMVSV
jgi:hypothetical protein